MALLVPSATELAPSVGADESRSEAAAALGFGGSLSLILNELAIVCVCG